VRLKPVKPHRPDPVQLKYHDGTTLLFSYEQPVAAFIPGTGYLITNLDVSPTTQKRIKEWVRDRPHVYVPQDEIFGVITNRPFFTRDTELEA